MTNIFYKNKTGSYLDRSGQYNPDVHKCPFHEMHPDSPEWIRNIQGMPVPRPYPGKIRGSRDQRHGLRERNQLQSQRDILLKDCENIV